MRYIYILLKIRSICSNSFERLTLRGWWVIAFALLLSIAYEQGVKKIKMDSLKLKSHLSELQNDYQTALDEHESLLLQINSQSDPDWIELVLMRVLGVVAEGQTKVTFQNEEL
jgi:hypothetical protein